MNSKGNVSFWLRLEYYQSKLILPFRSLICSIFTNNLIVKIMRISCSTFCEPLPEAQVMVLVESSCIILKF